MRPESVPSYSDLPEEEKSRYRQIDENGSFVERGAIEDPETAHRIALMENEAFGELEANEAEDALSIDEIAAKLGDRSIPYGERDALQEMLFRRADLQRMKGEPIDDELEEAMKKLYLNVTYSKLLMGKLEEGTHPGDVPVIAELLMDAKFTDNWRMRNKLEDDAQRIDALALCKESVSTACPIIDDMKSVDDALRMFQEVKPHADEKSFSDKNALESSGGRIVGKLFGEGKREKLVDLLKSGTFDMKAFGKILHRFGDEPRTLIELMNEARNKDEASSAMKYVADAELLDRTVSDDEAFRKLEDGPRQATVELAQRVSEALRNRPTVSALGELVEDREAKYGGVQPHSKFVVGLGKDGYVIAWSNMDIHEYHREIFQDLPRMDLKSGGYVGVREEDGKVMVRLVRSSGDYGYYGKEVLEHYRGDIEDALRKSFEGKEVELEIQVSGDREEDTSIAETA